MNRKTLFHSSGGYTLLEALLAMAMAAILLLAISGLVGSLFHAYRMSRQAQVDLEEARVALGVLTKTIRPATLTDENGSLLTGKTPTGGGTLYAYSNDLKVCISFRFNSGSGENSLEYVAFASSNDTGATVEDRANGCNFDGRDYKKMLASKITGGKFSMVPSSPLTLPSDVNLEENGSAGRVTVRFTVETDATHTSDLQTSVSLRDYEYIGFKK